ncbi:hypothetical protein JNJ66_00880 [Candidatus Saccharibacteria bacterium]|nr:hypothetical protein [Candidatus Saccharibacteria bacterium]
MCQRCPTRPQRPRVRGRSAGEAWERYNEQLSDWQEVYNRLHGGSSTIYDRQERSEQEPTGATGEIDPRTGQGHATQFYRDNTRVSWDTDGRGGESNIHWTNQGVGKKNRRRHRPPPHAR